MLTDNLITTGNRTTNFKLLQVNLQNTLVMNERGTLLACCSEHNDTIVFNKPIVTIDEAQDITTISKKGACIGEL